MNYVYTDWNYPRQYFQMSETEILRHLQRRYLVMTVRVDGTYIDIAVSRKAPSKYHLFEPLYGKAPKRVERA